MGFAHWSARTKVNSFWHDISNYVVDNDASNWYKAADDHFAELAGLRGGFS
jgi:hypothetical protein